MTGFSEVAKMRDHLKSVHYLSNDLLEQLNFKSGRFRSLKTLEEKWRLAFTILFPEVPEDKIPSPCRNGLTSPFGIDNNDNINDGEKRPSGPSNIPELITKDGSLSHDLLDVFAARIQNWVFDRLNVETKVPIDVKLDVIADFPLALEGIIADLADPATADVYKPIADEETNRSPPALDLDFSLSDNYCTTPIFEFADPPYTAEAIAFVESIFSIGKVDEEENMDCYTFHDDAKMDCYTFHGLPNLPPLATYSTVDEPYNDIKWAAEQLSMADVWPSVDDRRFVYQNDWFDH